MKTTSRAVLAALIAATLLLTGCASDDDTTPSSDNASAPASPSSAESPSAEAPAPTTSSGSDAQTTRLELWFVTEDGLYHSQRVAPATVAVGRAALEALFSGPGSQEAELGVTSAIPNGTRILGLTIRNGVATVDLSEEFTSGGGSASMQFRVAQVVYTLTQFPTVSAVRFMVEGERVSAIGGEGVVVEGRQTRDDWDAQLAPIVVTDPSSGDEVPRTFTVLGTANVFEATVQLRVVRADNGRVLGRTFTTATCGTGCRGKFEAKLKTRSSGTRDVILEVFESSAEDGRPIHVVRIPLMVQG